MTKTIKIFFGLTYLFSSVLCQNSENGYPFIKIFTSKDYHAAFDNWAVVQDQRGIMYFGNGLGVLEYDGSGWNLIPVAEDRLVNSLAIDSTGRVYVGSLNEFGYLRASHEGKMSFVSLRSLLPDTTVTFGEIWKIHIVDTGVYFQSFTHLFWYHDNIIEIIELNTDLSLLHRINNRLFIFQHGIGLSEIHKEKIKLLPGGELFKENSVREILPYDEQRVLIFCEEKLFLFNGKTFIPFSSKTQSIFSKACIYCAQKLPDDKYAIGTAGEGVFTIDRSGKITSHLTKVTGLSDNFILDLYIDSQSGLWCTNFFGISRINLDKSIGIYDTRSGIDTYTFALHKYDKTIYAGTFGGLFYKNKSGRFELFTKSLSDYRCFLSLNEGLLFGGNEGIYLLNKKGITEISSCYPQYILKSEIDTNTIYAAEDGLRKFVNENGNWKDRGLISGVEETLLSITESHDGSLWIAATNDGVIHLEYFNSQQPKVTHYGKAEGLTSQWINFIRIIDGKIRVCTNKGFCYFDPVSDRFVFDHEFHNMFSPSLPIRIISFEFDKNGNVWITEEDNSAGSSIHFYEKQNDNRYVERKNSTSKLNDLNLAVKLFDKDGSVWFGHEEGLYCYYPDKDELKNYSFSTRIRKVTLTENDSLLFEGNYGDKNGVGTLLQPSLSIPTLHYYNNSIRFEFAGLIYNSSEIEYQYFLEGQDEYWSDWKKENFKDYTNLTPSEYTFFVRSKNYLGVIGQEAKFSFIITPPWWSTIWFRGIIVIISILFIVWIVRKIYNKRINVLKREEQRRKDYSRMLIESQENERKRISSELHDSLGQNLIVLKNMIDFAIYNDVDKNDLKTKLKELSELTSGTIEETRTIASNLHPYQLRRLGLTKALNALIRDTQSSTELKITFSLDSVEGIIPKEAEAHIYRIAQESVNNILKHSGADTIEFNLIHNTNHVELTIIDNGKGFSPENNESNNTSLKGGFGLFGIKERAQIVGGSLNISSAINHGTKIRLTIPVGV